MVALHITLSALGENSHRYFNNESEAKKMLDWYKERAIETWSNEMTISVDTDSEFYFDTYNHTERYYIETINLF